MTLIMILERTKLGHCEHTKVITGEFRVVCSPRENKEGPLRKVEKLGLWSGNYNKMVQ